MSNVTRRNFFGLAAAAPAVAVAAVQAVKAAEPAKPQVRAGDGFKVAAIVDLGPVRNMIYFDDRLYFMTDTGMHVLEYTGNPADPVSWSKP